MKNICDIVDPNTYRRELEIVNNNNREQQLITTPLPLKRKVKNRLRPPQRAKAFLLNDKETPPVFSRQKYKAAQQILKKYKRIWAKNERNNKIVKYIVNKLIYNLQSVLIGKNLQNVRNLSRVFFTRKLFKSKFHRDLYIWRLIKKYDIKNGIELYNFITIEQ